MSDDVKADWARRAVTAMVQRYREDLAYRRPHGATPVASWGDGWDLAMEHAWTEIAERLETLLEQPSVDLSVIIADGERIVTRKLSTHAGAIHDSSGGWKGYRKGFHDGYKRIWEGALRELIAVSEGRDPELSFNCGRPSVDDHRPVNADSVEWFYERRGRTSTEVPA